MRFIILPLLLTSVWHKRMVQHDGFCYRICCALLGMSCASEIKFHIKDVTCIISFFSFFFRANYYLVIEQGHASEKARFYIMMKMKEDEKLPCKS